MARPGLELQHHSLQARRLLSTGDPGQVIAAPVLACEEGLSFWGGVDPDTGAIIDAHHPQRGAVVSGQIVMMPTSRGSCSGSGVLLALALGGKAPAALVFREPEETLSLGALVASRLFDRPVPVLFLPPPDYAALAGAEWAQLDAAGLSFDLDGRQARAIAVGGLGAEAVQLNDTDRARLAGGQGRAVQVAMEVIAQMAAAQGATELLDVSRGHIDGCILAHDANLIFAETMANMGAQVGVPTTINAISVDREAWQDQGVPADFGQRASRLAEAYVRMRAQPTFTCAPYHREDRPLQGEVIGWSESNAVIYATSVLGARTTKHPDYLDLFIAMTGRAPRAGVYEDKGRRPARVLHFDLPSWPDADDSLWPLVGWLAGKAAPDCVPLITGFEAAALSEDDLRAICAAFGTTSGAPMLHVSGHTPEADLTPLAGAERVALDAADLRVLGTRSIAPADRRSGGHRQPPRVLRRVPAGRRIARRAVLRRRSHHHHSGPRRACTLAEAPPPCCRPPGCRWSPICAGARSPNPCSRPRLRASSPTPASTPTTPTACPGARFGWVGWRPVSMPPFRA